MIVYRVEHFKDRSECGHRAGPYVHGCHDDMEARALAHALATAHGWDATRPGPLQDGILTADRSYVYGLGSLKEIAYWFDGFIERLRDVGYVIGVYEADDVLKGDLQVAFNSKTARLLKLKGMRACLNAS